MLPKPARLYTVSIPISRKTSDSNINIFSELIFFLFLLNSFLASAQNKEEKIKWNENVDLTWNDYRGKVPAKTEYYANSNSGLSFSWGLTSDQNGKVVDWNYNIKTNFYPEFSWVQPKSKTEYLLIHEQLHFDITELQARKLNQKLAEVTVESLGNKPKKVLNTIYTEIEQEREKLQNEYDSQSMHSLNHEKQKEWENFIAQQLKEYEDFKI